MLPSSIDRTTTFGGPPLTGTKGSSEVAPFSAPLDEQIGHEVNNFRAYRTVPNPDLNTLPAPCPSNHETVPLILTAAARATPN